MGNLKGKTILIGKEPGQGRICISVIVAGQPRTTAVGIPGSVPNCVSRCRPSEGVAHCKIDVDMNGKMTITNMKPENVTYVGGMEVETKRIDESSTIALGRDKYPLDLSLVLRTADTLAGGAVPQPRSAGAAVKPEPKEYSIAHLEKVYKEYEETMEEIQRNQQAVGKRRLLPIMLGSASGLITTICAVIGIQNSLYIGVPITVVIFALYLLNFTHKDTSIEDRQAAQNKLYDEYVCPNPECRHFLGNKPYRILKQDKKCPYCGSRFIH